MKIVLYVIMIINFAITSAYAFPPQAIIISPENEAAFQASEQINFKGQGLFPATDRSSVVTGLTWSSSLNGYLGGGEDVAAQLSAGNHTITLEVTSSDGSDSTSIIISVLE